MDSKEFGSLRQQLQKTQKEMAELLGTSLKAVQSFEQGWRNVPVHVERHMLFLLTARKGKPNKSPSCWDMRNCSLETREACPAWEFNLGDLCWFINGTICHGKAQGTWVKKMKLCRSCFVFSQKMESAGIGYKNRKHVPAQGKCGKRKNA